jgi:uncharacterized membrane protein YcaP (DUF421 family)
VVTIAGVGLLAAVAARTAVVLLVVAVGVRLTGRRQMGGMNAQDLLVLLLVANAVQNPLTSGSGSPLVAVASSGTLILLVWAIGRVFVARPGVERRLMGAPTVLVRAGRVERAAMRAEGIDEDELMAAIRDRGLADPADVRLAVLEMDGAITVVPEKEARGRGAG